VKHLIITNTLEKQNGKNLNKDLNILYEKYPNINLFFGVSRTKGKTVEIHNNMAKTQT